jgi:hypothetical protein
VTDKLVKVFFALSQDEHGYPPVTVESVWARVAEQPAQFVLDNIPFFARSATIGDVVAVKMEDEQRWFDRVALPSGNSLIRVAYFDLDQRERIEDRLRSLGCSMEYFGRHRLLALNVPSTSALSDVQGFLGAELAAGTLDYEEPILRQ